MTPEREEKLRTPGFVEQGNYCEQDIYDLLTLVDQLREEIYTNDMGYQQILGQLEVEIEELRDGKIQQVRRLSS